MIGDCKVSSSHEFARFFIKASRVDTSLAAALCGRSRSCPLVIQMKKTTNKKKQQNKTKKPQNSDISRTDVQMLKIKKKKNAKNAVI